MYSLLLAVFVVGAGLQQPARDSVAPAKQKAPAEEVRTPALSSPSSGSPVAPPPLARERAESLYMSILEKTNSQLSLWWNPYGVMIAALGVLFTVGAISVTLLLFRQSSDYQRKIDQALENQQKILSAYMEEHRGHLEELRSGVQHQVQFGNRSWTRRGKPIGRGWRL